MTEKVKVKKPQNGQQKTASDFDAHRTMVVWIFVATFTFSFIIGVMLYSFHEEGLKKKEINDIPVLIVVMASGVIGSFVSALNRIYSSRNIFPNHHYRDFFKNANSYLIIYSMIPPLVGAISAVILYVIFAGEMITGSLFPSFHCSIGKNSCKQFQDFLNFWQPDKPTDYAKAIIWGFVAGFSERFVPDVLNKISKKSEQIDSKKKS